jgi:hypothetical protein
MIACRAFQGLPDLLAFLNRQWEALKAEIKPSDELWTFVSPADSWRQFAGLMGVCFAARSQVN